MWKWLEEPATPRDGESQDEAERRQTWVDRVWKGWFAWEIVIPMVGIVLVCLVLLIRSIA